MCKPKIIRYCVHDLKITLANPAPPLAGPACGWSHLSSPMSRLFVSCPSFLVLASLILSSLVLPSLALDVSHPLAYLSLFHPRPPGRPQPAHMRHEQRASVDALGGQSARQVKIDMVVERCRRSKARQRTFCCSEAVRTVIFTQRRRPRAYATNGHSATDISGEVWAERTSGPSRWSLVHHGWTPSRR